MAGAVNPSSVSGIVDVGESWNTLAAKLNLLFSSATFQGFSDAESGSEVSILRTQSSAPTAVANDFWNDTTSRLLRVYQGGSGREGWRPIGVGVAITNSTGGSRVDGDVVGFTTPNDFSYNSDARAKIAGVVGESVSDGSVGLLRMGGCSTTVKVNGTVARGEFLKKSGSSGNEAVTNGAVLNGSFAIALTANASGSGTVTAYLFPYNSTT